MTHNHALETVDRMVRDIVNKDKPIGGQTLIFSGDFRLILPLVKSGTKTDHINSCLKTSVMWKNIRLTKKMRVFLSNNQDTATFENHLLDIGNEMTQKKMVWILSRAVINWKIRMNSSRQFMKM